MIFYDLVLHISDIFSFSYAKWGPANLFSPGTFYWGSANYTMFWTCYWEIGFLLSAILMILIIKSEYGNKKMS